MAINTALSGIPLWGTDIGGFVPTAGLHGRAARALVPVRRVLSALPRARPRLASAPAVGLEPRRARADRVADLSSGSARASCTTRRRADLPEVPRAALPADAVPLLGRARVHEDAACRSCARCGCTTRTIPSRPREAINTSGAATCSSRPSSRKARRHAKSICRRALVRLLDGGGGGGRTRDRSRGRSRDDADLRARRRDPSDGAGAGSTPREPVERSARRSTVYPGADGDALLYEDDGESFAYRKTGTWMGLRMRWADASRRLTLSLEPGSKMIAGSRVFEVRLAGAKAVKKVTFTGATQTIGL